MHPKSWLDAALGSRGRVRVLRTLCADPARVWTERELAGAVGMSPNTVNVAVGQLRDAGILDFRRLGRTHAVRLRTDLPLVALVRRVFEVELEAWPALESAVRRAVPQGVACYLYGSSARGTATSESDVDLLVVANSDEQAEDAAAIVREAAMQVFPTGIEVVAMGRQKLAKRKSSSYIQNILRDGVPLGDRPLEAFL